MVTGCAEVPISSRALIVRSAAAIPVPETTWSRLPPGTLRKESPPEPMRWKRRSPLACWRSSRAPAPAEIRVPPTWTTSGVCEAPATEPAMLPAPASSVRLPPVCT